MNPSLYLLALLFPCATELPAQQSNQGQPLDARVIAVDQTRVEIDRGLADGLRQGDRVRFLPPTGAVIEGSVFELTDRTSAIFLKEVSGSIDVGTRAEAFPSVLKSGQQKTAESGVEHPPWENEINQWPAGKHLLAPMSGLKPEERAMTISGRLYAASDLVNDGERNNSSSWSRLGADVHLGNLLGYGGDFHIDVEYNQSQFKPSGGASQTDSQLRIDRISYARGGDRHRALQWQIGRFLQSGFPEFGVIDGAEANYRFQGGQRMGASYGFLPILYGNFGTTQDSQFALHYQAQNESGSASFGAGIQKTWHDSAADRDLLVLKANTRSTNGMYFYANAWFDLYDGTDNFKNGSELTRATASGGYRSREGNGWSANATLFRFPQLLQTQVFSVDPGALIYTQNETRRLSVDLFRSFQKNLRGSARISYWGDQDDSGMGGELRCSVRDLLMDGSQLGGSLFLDQGRFTDSTGIRLNAGFPTPGGRLRLLWETGDYQNNSFSTPNADLLQHRLRGSWDVSLSDSWSLSLYLEQRAGDQQDSQAAGFYLQKVL
ncbi:MAG: hypothetical protein QM477_00140 [Planctomycetota bacterium]